MISLENITRNFYMDEGVDTGSGSASVGEKVNPITVPKTVMEQLYAKKALGDAWEMPESWLGEQALFDDERQFTEQDVGIGATRTLKGASFVLDDYDEKVIVELENAGRLRLFVEGSEIPKGDSIYDGCPFWLVSYNKDPLVSIFYNQDSSIDTAEVKMVATVMLPAEKLFKTTREKIMAVECDLADSSLLDGIEPKTPTEYFRMVELGIISSGEAATDPVTGGTPT